MQDHAALADRRERDLDLALGVEWPPPLAPRPVELALRLRRRHEPEKGGGSSSLL